jgi:hypothetical protein
MELEEYKLEKWIWTEKDFNNMGWHDSTIYSLRFQENLELDIDYIFRWNKSEVEGFYYTFWVAPATLVFKNPSELTFEFSDSFDYSFFEIEDIVLETDDKTSWTIIFRQGHISFKACNFKQIIRKRPSLQLNQKVPFDERGGISFSIIPGDGKTEALTSDIIERRRKQFQEYEMAKKLLVLKSDLEGLLKSRLSDQIETKEFLIKKKKLKVKIDSISFQLRGTRYSHLEFGVN